MPICSLERERKARSGIWSPAYSLPPAFSLWQSVFSKISHGKAFPDTLGSLSRCGAYSHSLEPEWALWWPQRPEHREVMLHDLVTKMVMPLPGFLPPGSCTEQIQKGAGLP